MAIFEKQNPDGSYAWTDEEVRELVPLLFLAAPGAEKLEMLPPPLIRALGEFASRLGVGPKAKPAEVQRAIDGYYAENPPNPKLLASLRKVLRQSP